MTMKRHILIVAGAMLAGTAGAQPAPPPGPPGDARERIKTELGLTDEQVERLRALKVEENKANIRRRADLAVARIELEEMLGAATVDERALAAKIKAVSDMQAAAAKARLEARLALRKVLSAEQYAKLKALRGARGRAMGPRMRNRAMPRRMGPAAPGGRPGPGPRAPRARPGDDDPLAPPEWF
jgi:Spy/CpxP family protein refolding chaperone